MKYILYICAVEETIIGIHSWEYSAFVYPTGCKIREVFEQLQKIVKRRNMRICMNLWASLRTA